MNSKLDEQIINFMNSVGHYIRMEYDEKYSIEFANPSTLNALYDFIGAYYMGGNTVPDVSRYVVEFINRIIWESK